MSAAMIAALVCSVALLVTTAYFIMGSIPLLILKHDTPMDARFVRGFFNLYYRAALATSVATALCYGLAGRLGLAAGAAGLAVLALTMRRRIIPAMDSIGAQIQTNALEGIPGFRRTHATAIAVNLVQLICIVWSLTTLKD